MNKQSFTILTLTAIIPATESKSADHNTEHTNIVLIMCDDMGFSDLSCYGGEVHTPNIDYLAEQGRFIR